MLTRDERSVWNVRLWIELIVDSVEIRNSVDCEAGEPVEWPRVNYFRC